jgi:four helix bundle protein
MFPFENLEVYKKAFQLNQKIYALVKSNKTVASYINNQFGRAGLSIMLNIAEGSAKYSCKDRRNYFITARGSVFECCSIISFLYEEDEISEDFKNNLYSGLEEISRILYVMINNLKNG